jgi:hypothetical protein
MPYIASIYMMFDGFGSCRFRSGGSHRRNDNVASEAMPNQEF